MEIEEESKKITPKVVYYTTNYEKNELIKVIIYSEAYAKGLEAVREDFELFGRMLGRFILEEAEKQERGIRPDIELETIKGNVNIALEILEATDEEF